MNLTNLSPETLHIGHISGGFPLAQRYPQTLQRYTGLESLVGILAVPSSIIFSLSSGEGLLSGIDLSSFSPSLFHLKCTVHSNMPRSLLGRDPCKNKDR